MRENARRPSAHFRALAGLLVAALAVPPPAAGVDLRPKTLEAFERYARLVEERVNREVAGAGPFLWSDTLAEPRKQQVATLLRRGEVAIERLQVLEGDKPFKAPDGLIHHWVAVVFIPGATLEQTLAVVQNYDRHKDFYKPDVMRSRTLERHGDDFRIYLRFHKKKVITVVLDTEHAVHYRRVSPARVESRSRTTRVLEVVDHDKPSEQHKPEGRDSGFLWRIYTWWRFEERDGGTYVQCESVSLTRAIPTGLGWLIGPFVNDVPKESLVFTLEKTRSALRGAPADDDTRKTSSPD